jgi:hypothetical protein
MNSRFAALLLHSCAQTLSLVALRRPFSPTHLTIVRCVLAPKLFDAHWPSRITLSQVATSPSQGVPPAQLASPAVQAAVKSFSLAVPIPIFWTSQRQVPARAPPQAKPTHQQHQQPHHIGNISNTKFTPAPAHFGSSVNCNHTAAAVPTRLTLSRM